MNKNFFKYLILVVLILLIGGGFFISSTKAESGLILETTKECNIQYSGDSCIAELKLTNNTGKILDGEAFLHIDYQGLCSNNELRDFDGKGIEAQFSIADNSWLNFSDDWENGMTTVSGFSIPKDEIQSKLKIETVPSLCPGKYTFTFELKGTAKEKEYITSPVVIGGGGGVFVSGLKIYRESASDISDNGATITWLTNSESTSRVIYSPKGFPHLLKINEPPNYGYVFSTPEDSNKVTFHTVTIDGLLPGTTYYFRCISHASPPTIGREYSFTTLGVRKETQGEAGEKISEETTEEAEEEMSGEVEEKKIEEKGKIVVAGGEIVSPLGFEEKRSIEEKEEKGEISEKGEASTSKAKPGAEKKPKGILNNLLARIGGFVSGSYILLIVIFAIALIALIILRKRRKRKSEQR